MTDRFKRDSDNLIIVYKNFQILFSLIRSAHAYFRSSDIASELEKRFSRRQLLNLKDKTKQIQRKTKHQSSSLTPSSNHSPAKHSAPSNIKRKHEL